MDKITSKLFYAAIFSFVGVFPSLASANDYKASRKEKPVHEKSIGNSEKNAAPSINERHVFDEEYTKSPLAMAAALKKFEGYIQNVKYAGFDVRYSDETVIIDTKDRFGCTLSEEAKVWTYDKGYYMIPYYFMAHPENSHLYLSLRSCGKPFYVMTYNLKQWIKNNTEEDGGGNVGGKLATAILYAPPVPKPSYFINKKKVSEDKYRELMERHKNDNVVVLPENQPAPKPPKVHKAKKSPVQKKAVAQNDGDATLPVELR